MKKLLSRTVLSLAGILMLCSMRPVSDPVEHSAKIATGGESFAVFLSHFPKVELPFEMEITDFIHTVDLQKGEKGLRRTKYIPEINRKRFGRMGPPTAVPVARFYPDEESIAVIYRSTPYFGRGLSGTYQLIRYDLRGKIIPFNQPGRKKLLQLTIGHFHREQATTFRITSDGDVQQTTYGLVWKEPLKRDYLSAQGLKQAEMKETKLLRISADGRVTTVELPDNKRV